MNVSIEKRLAGSLAVIYADSTTCMVDKFLNMILLFGATRCKLRFK